MIETEYTLDFSDYKAAQWLYMKHRRGAMVTYVLLLWVIPLAAVCFAAWTIALWLARPNGALPVVGAITAGLLWASVVFLLSRWLTIRRGYKRIFPEGAAKMTRLTVDAEQVLSSIPGRSEGKYFWGGIEDYAEDDQCALIFVRRKVFLMVPHRALSPEQWVALRALMREKGVGRG